jgi:hypothetical protein
VKATIGPEVKDVVDWLVRYALLVEESLERTEKRLVVLEKMVEEPEGEVQ